jgi:hypothetical protein
MFDRSTASMTSSCRSGREGESFELRAFSRAYPWSRHLKSTRHSTRVTLTRRLPQDDNPVMLSHTNRLLLKHLLSASPAWHPGRSWRRAFPEEASDAAGAEPSSAERCVEDDGGRAAWSETLPLIIYKAYPDQDLLSIKPPAPGETMAAFKRRAEEAGDTLLPLLCREADDDIDAAEYAARLDRAIRDITSVRDAFRRESHPGRCRP